MCTEAEKRNGAVCLCCEDNFNMTTFMKKFVDSVVKEFNNLKNDPNEKNTTFEDMLKKNAILYEENKKKREEDIKKALEEKEKIEMRNSLPNKIKDLEDKIEILLKDRDKLEESLIYMYQKYDEILCKNLDLQHYLLNLHNFRGDISELQSMIITKLRSIGASQIVELFEKIEEIKKIRNARMGNRNKK